MEEKKITDKEGSKVKGSMQGKGKKYSALAIAGFVFSLLFFIPVFSIIGIVCGIAGLVKISRDKTLKGKGLAISAIIIGVIVTLLQILIVIAIYNFYMTFHGIAKDFHENTPEKSWNECLEKRNGIGKDICIFLTITMYMSTNKSIDNIDKDLCDEHISNSNVKYICYAVLMKDTSYCENIIKSEERIKCYGLVEELNRGEK